MKHELAPVIDIYDLIDGLFLQYGNKFVEDLSNAGGIRKVLFGNNYDYTNDCKILYIDEKTIEECEDILEKNILIFLYDIFPEYVYVVIDERG